MLITSLFFLISALACSFSGIRQRGQIIKQTAQALQTDIKGVINAGESLLHKAQAIETKYPGALETAQVLATKGASMISTIRAVGTNNPGLIQTAQALINNDLPAGEPPDDIPILDREQAINYFGSSRYIIYSIPIDYTQVLDFYQSEMTANGWQYMDDESHEYANAAQITYYKDIRKATINLSLNPIIKTTVIVINISTE